MRKLLILTALFVGACARDRAAPPPAPAAPARAAPQVDANAIRGTVAEKIDAAQYTYLRLDTAQGEVWAAVPKTDKAVGAQVAVVNAAWMQDFKSESLGRTWPRIAFGTLEESATGATSATATDALPSGHPAIAGAGKGGPAHPPQAAAADLGTVKVAKAAGADGRTIADIWARRTALKDQKVSVRGKVAKVTNGVLGKNWLHLRDGTGEGATADLTVSSTGTAAVGDTVLVSGVVHLDKDLGAGYHYDVIVEDATVKVE